MRKIIKLISLFLFVSIFTEGITRVLTSHFIVFDIEMLKYSQRVKRYLKKENFFIHKKGVQDHLMGADVLINEEGLRESLAPKEGLPNIAFLGDSLTFGWGVKKEITFEELLEKKIGKGFNFLNLGHCNFNTEQEIKLFWHLSSKINFKHVVLFYFINDAEKTQSIKKPSLWTYSYFLVLLHSRFKFLLKAQDYRQYYRNLYFGKDENWTYTRERIKSFSENLKLKGIDLSVIILPELHKLNPYEFLDIHKMIKDDLIENDIKVKDMANIFSHIKKPKELWVAMDDAHPNQKAHKIIANNLETFFLKEILYEK